MRNKSSRADAKAKSNHKVAERSSDVERGQSSVLRRIFSDCGFRISGVQSIPAREARLASISAELHPHVRKVLSDKHPEGLYSHQSAAIEKSLAGHDVCLATSTASGKSLPVMVTAAHEILSDPVARVLVLYPARALIQDQLAKWNALLEPLGHKAGFIDGSVPTGERNEILSRSRIVLMTPDVAHAWLMSNLNEKPVRAFRTNLKLLALDEAHVYDGVFGTNMAYFMRRLQGASSRMRLICSTATLGSPTGFIQQLTGRTCLEIGPDDDGSRMPGKQILSLRSNSGDSFEAAANALRLLARDFPGRFLAFCDSRKMVETLTAATRRHPDGGLASAAEADNEMALDATALSGQPLILPYRAGYEAEDRNQIQSALSNGALRGVIATSALELGLDIGEIDLVVMIDTPSSVKSFWQRAGRAGRRNCGYCVVMDNRETIKPGDDGLAEFLSRPIEPNWLYLQNRYVQYSNALCAASEIGQINGSYDRSYMSSLPAQFREFLENELNPATSVAPDLYPLKQSAQDEPHFEFPIRNSAEKTYRIVTRMKENKGDISFSQALREAYPGAVYYYMATPYRVLNINNRNREIIVERERSYSTKPIYTAMVFLDFTRRVLRLSRSNSGFLAEAEMQVRERVSGFKEKKGQAETTHTYGNGSSFQQKPLDRLFHTSGVCWHSAKPALVSDVVAQSVLQAFCAECGIHARDVGVGRFHSPKGPDGFDATNGVCIFDNANGSLRLTERLAENFPGIVQAAIKAEEVRGNHDLMTTLRELLAEVEKFMPVALLAEEPTTKPALTRSTENIGETEEWVTVVAPGEKAILFTTSGNQEVTVLNCIYNPKGLHYHLACDREGVKWFAPIAKIEPILGHTKLAKFNMMTGELAQS